MDLTELKDLLSAYRKQGKDKIKLKRLWEELSNEENEERIKTCLLSELKNFDIEDTNAKNADFDQMFKKIQSSIKQTEIPESTNKSNKRIWSLSRVAAILVIAFVSGGALSYFLFKAEPEIISAYTVIRAPLGAKSEVILPDGSQVWINAGSSIKYDNNFNKTTRNILLDGEAYFKVAKNKKVPFIVNTADIDIVAVGTEFNVKAYADEDLIETTLVEGKVAIKGDENSKNKDIKQVMLESQQKAVYVRNDKQVKIVSKKSKEIVSKEDAQLSHGIVYIAKRIDPLPIIAWKDSKLIIRGEELSDLAVKLERKYNVNISFDSNAIMKYRFSGTLEDETLTQVLDVIKLTSPIDYKLEGKEVTIYENSSMLKKFNNYLNRK